MQRLAALCVAAALAGPVPPPAQGQSVTSQLAEAAAATDPLYASGPSGAPALGYDARENGRIDGFDTTGDDNVGTLSAPGAVHQPPGKQPRAGLPPPQPQLRPPVQPPPPEQPAVGQPAAEHPVRQPAKQPPTAQPADPPATEPYAKPVEQQPAKKNPALERLLVAAAAKAASRKAEADAIAHASVERAQRVAKEARDFHRLHNGELEQPLSPPERPLAAGQPLSPPASKPPPARQPPPPPPSPPSPRLPVPFAVTWPEADEDGDGFLNGVEAGQLLGRIGPEGRAAALAELDLVHAVWIHILQQRVVLCRRASTS
jgi:hypothetical protein